MHRKHFVLIGLLISLSSCGGATNTYRLMDHSWVGDSISFHVGLMADSMAHPSLPKITLVCKSCNFVNPPFVVAFDAQNNAKVAIPETIQNLSARLNLKGSGIDTTFIQKQRAPAEASAYYHLTQPLIGRVFVNQESPLYSDSTMGHVAGSTMVGDELNIFAERPNFFLVHDPLYANPLWLLKLNAYRMY